MKRYFCTLVFCFLLLPPAWSDEYKSWAMDAGSIYAAALAIASPDSLSSDRDQRALSGLFSGYTISFIDSVDGMSRILTDEPVPHPYEQCMQRYEFVDLLPYLARFVVESYRESEGEDRGKTWPQDTILMGLEAYCPDRRAAN